jgi:hypothetical protein
MPFVPIRQQQALLQPTCKHVWFMPTGDGELCAKCFITKAEYTELYAESVDDTNES